MKLTAADLRLFADALEKLNVTELNVTQFKVGMYSLKVESKSDGRNSLVYYLTNIASASLGVTETIGD